MSKFKEGDDWIAQYVKTLDLKKIWEKYKDLSIELGNCFLTTCDIFETIENNDCFCLTLDVTRS